MRIEIGTTSGKTFVSDEFTSEDVQKGIDAKGGYIGTGDFSNKYFDSVEKVLDFMLSFFQYNTKYEQQTAHLMIGEEEVNFNVAHIEWYKLVRDQE